MTKQAVTMNDVKVNSLFICPGVGVLRKVGAVTATEKGGKIRVIYPNEPVALLKPRGDA